MRDPARKFVSVCRRSRMQAGEAHGAWASPNKLGWQSVQPLVCVCNSGDSPLDQLTTGLFAWKCRFKSASRTPVARPPRRCSHPFPSDHQRTLMSRAFCISLSAGFSPGNKNLQSACPATCFLLKPLPCRNEVTGAVFGHMSPSLAHCLLLCLRKVENFFR